jgi:O-antigen/teichoic acid export membrane protein
VLLSISAVTLRFTLGRSPWVLALAHGVSQAGCIAGALWLYGRTFSLGRTARAALSERGPRGLWPFALPMLASDGLAVAQSRVDLLALARLVSLPATIGMYAVAKQIANVVNVVRFSFDPVFWPRVAALSRAGDREGLAATYRLVARWVALLALPAAIAIGRLGPDFGRLIGKGYHGPLSVFLLLALGQAANAIFGLAGHLMAMAGRPRIVVYGYLVGIALTIALSAALVPRLGIAGAAGASALAYVLVTSYQVLQVLRAHGISPLSPGLYKVALCGAVMAFVLAVLSPLIQPIWALVVAVTLYFAAFRLVGPEPEDFALFARFRRKAARDSAGS